MANQKNRITVQIANTSLTLVTDEDAGFVRKLAKQLDDKIHALTKSNFRTTVLDAALLCALDAEGENMKAEEKIRTLEEQVRLCETDLENLRSRPRTDAEPVPSPETEEVSTQLRASDNGSESSAEEKIRALEKYLENKKSAPASSESARLREEKIRYIESLLRGSSEEA